MSFIIIALLIVLLVVILLAATLEVIFTLNSNNQNLNLTLLYLCPFLKAVVTNNDTKLILTIYLFNKSILRKALKKGKGKTNGIELIRQVKPTDINVSTSYGFRDPYITGVACGAINIASQFINIDSIQHNPDFNAGEDYIYIDATAKVKLGQALVSFFRAHN
jgi:hypothetical protein